MAKPHMTFVYRPGPGRRDRVWVASLLLLGACSLLHRRSAIPPAGPTVVASWYGPGFHGERTASGERFDQNALTAAHPSLPFGTRVELTNPANGRSVTVRVNDRGPRRRGRGIDLSRAAARRLGMEHGGTARVMMRVLDREDASASR